MWQPALAIQSLKNRQNAVAVLLDTSRSMSFGADGTTRLEQATSALAERVLPGLEGKFRPLLYGFGSAPKRLESIDMESMPPPAASSGIGE